MAKWDMRKMTEISESTWGGRTLSARLQTLNGTWIHFKKWRAGLAAWRWFGFCLPKPQPMPSLSKSLSGSFAWS
jgi:hypothetical protein